MSFDILFHKPGLELEDDEPLDDVTLQIVSRVVVAHGGPAETDGDGFFWPGFEFFIGDTAGAMLELRGDFTREHASFLYDVMKATGWVVVIPSDPLVVLSTLQTTLEEVGILNEGTELRLAASPSDVAAAIGPEFQDWSAFRDGIGGGR